MTHQLMSPRAQVALSKKIQILAKYGFTINELDSIYDLIFAKPDSNAFALYGMSPKDQGDLMEAIQIIFSEASGMEEQTA